VYAGELSRRLTLNIRVRGMRVFKARWWVAIKLLRMAAIVAGCNIEIEKA
jgi:hypothetical protein